MIVLDSSFFLTNIFADEGHPLVSKAFHAIEHAELETIAPNIFFYEIHNSLYTAVLRKRIKKTEVPDYLKLFALSPVSVVECGSSDAIMKLAFSHKLSFYDAAYLELALRRNIPLATLDGKLHDAATKEGVVYR